MSAPEIRPSMLPKLAECSHYQSEANAGPAAARGTNLDRRFRAWINLGASVTPMPEGERLALQWAVETARNLADGAPLVADEDRLKVEFEGIPGTADLSCPERLWSADLKSGQRRNYREQQALYALGFMDRTFSDEWTVYLLYLDLRELETLRFTRESAEAVVRQVLAKVHDGGPATPCDYCDWCAKRWTCAPRLEKTAWFLNLDPRTVDLSRIEDPVRLAAALDLTHDIAREKGIHDQLKGRAVDHVQAGREVHGWRMQKGRETQTVAPSIVLPLLKQAPAEVAAGILGKVSASKFETLWAATKGGEMIPPDAIETNHGAPFLAKAKGKKAD
jgi:hypothetical protein